MLLRKIPCGLGFSNKDDVASDDDISVNLSAELLRIVVPAASLDAFVTAFISCK